MVYGFVIKINLLYVSVKKGQSFEQKNARMKYSFRAFFKYRYKIMIINFGKAKSIWKWAIIIKPQLKDN
jgi:hypothetical protein